MVTSRVSRDFRLTGICFMGIWIYACFLPCGQAQVSRGPKYVLPLANTTVYREVVSGRDAVLPPASQCFVFSPGHPDLPYSALTLRGEENEYVDFYLNGRTEFTDISLSLYVFPTGEPQGTILNYLCETGNVIKLSILEGLLFVSFWDEYGVSVGATAIPDLLLPDSWNHLAISRQFDNGRIKIHHNGALVDDIDDDFPNQISLPARGSIRLGSSQKEAEEPKFKGRFACFQIYFSILTDQEVLQSKDYCLPKAWNVQPEINLEPKEFDGVEKLCVTDYVPPILDGSAEPKDCEVIDLSCLVNGVNWDWLVRRNQWKPSERNSAHFRLLRRDFAPVGNEELELADVMMTSRKTCPRLCMRLSKCQAFYYQVQSANQTRCALYKKAEGVNLQPQEGAVFFSLL